MRRSATGAALRRRTRALTTPGGLFLTAALIAAVVPATAPIRDPDFWWHLRTGQLILDHHALLDTDPFTYTVASHHWVMHEWLTEVSFAGLHQIGGLGLIVAVLTAVTIAGIGLIAARARLPIPGWRVPAGGAAACSDEVGRRVHFLPLGIGMVLAGVAGYPIWGPRAQMITFTLTCLTLWLVERHLRRGGRAIWWLCPIVLIWANLHSGFIVGVGFAAAVLVAEWGARLLGLDGRAPWHRVRRLGSVIAACLLVVIVNPSGAHIYLYPFETQGSAAQQSLIEEWHSPNFHEPVVLAFGLMLISLAVMIVASRRVRPRDAALALLTTAMALQSVRHIALFIAAATPLWIEQADILLVAWRRRRARRRPATRRQARTPRPAPLPFRLGALALVSLAALSIEAPKLAAAVATREDSRFYAGDFPVCASRWLAAAPTGLRIFNQYGEGGYLALHLASRNDRVFIFGDAALMGDALLYDYGAAEDLTPRWEQVVGQGGRTDIIVFDAGTPLATVLAADPRWQLVYSDTRSVAYVPADAAGLALRDRLPDSATTAGSDGVCTAGAAVAAR